MSKSSTNEAGWWHTATTMLTALCVYREGRSRGAANTKTMILGDTEMVAVKLGRRLACYWRCSCEIV